MSETDTVEYRFAVEREIWEDWKDTVPRTKNLDERLIELIQEDIDG